MSDTECRDPETFARDPGLGRPVACVVVPSESGEAYLLSDDGDGWFDLDFGDHAEIVGRLVAQGFHREEGVVLNPNLQEGVWILSGKRDHLIDGEAARATIMEAVARDGATARNAASGHGGGAGRVRKGKAHRPLPGSEAAWARRARGAGEGRDGPRSHPYLDLVRYARWRARVSPLAMRIGLTRDGPGAREHRARWPARSP